MLVNQKIKRFQASDDGDVSPGAASSGCSLRSSTEGRAPLDLGNGTVVVNGVDHNRKLWNIHHSRRTSSNRDMIDLD